MEKPTLGGLSFSIHLWIWKKSFKIKYFYKPTHLQSWIHWFYSFPLYEWNMSPALSQRGSAASTKISNCRTEELLLSYSGWYRTKTTTLFVRARSEQKDLTVFSNVGNSAGSTSTSPKIGVQTEWERKSHLPPWLGRARVHRGRHCAVNTQEQGGLWEKAASPCSQPAHRALKGFSASLYMTFWGISAPQLLKN